MPPTVVIDAGADGSGDELSLSGKSRRGMAARAEALPREVASRGPMIDRRAFVGMVAAGFALAPVAPRAQPATRMRRIGVLAPQAPGAPQYEEPLRELGWIEGKNIVTERRFTESIDLLPQAADELIRLKVELIITDGTD